MGQIDDVGRCVSMDLKTPGNLLYQVGVTRNELGGSHYALVQELDGGAAPQVDSELARRVFQSLHAALRQGLVRACHDLSEGGLAAAVAEMAFAGGCGAQVDADRVPASLDDVPVADRATALLFAESNTRFVCEVPAASAEAFERLLADVPLGRIGQVTDSGRLEIRATVDGARATLVSEDLAELKEAWQSPLRW